MIAAFFLSNLFRGLDLILNFFHSTSIFLYKNDKTMEKQKPTKNIFKNKYLSDVIRRSFEKFKDKDACGIRTYIGMYDSKRVLFGKTKWLKYSELEKACDKVSHFLLQITLQITKNTEDSIHSDIKKPTLLIYEDTCFEWTVCCLAAWLQKMTVVTSFATLGIDSMLEAYFETKSNILVCNRKNIRKIIDCLIIQRETKRFTNQVHILYTDHRIESNDIYPWFDSNIPSYILIHSLSDILNSTNLINDDNSDTPFVSKKTNDNDLNDNVDNNISESDDDDISEFDDDDNADETNKTTCAIIMYTSGSTGRPKGVMLSHDALLSTINSIRLYLSHNLKINDLSEQVHLAYLPSAHIFELLMGLTTLLGGGSVGYADPWTLTSKGAVRMCSDDFIQSTALRNPQIKENGQVEAPGAIQEFRPTMIVGVPKVWEMIKQGVENRINNLGSIQKYLMNIFLESLIEVRNEALKSNKESPFLILEQYESLFEPERKIR